jgi:ABC-type dipeptide/oligopeptide/nickel transport system permease component
MNMIMSGISTALGLVILTIVIAVLAIVFSTVASTTTDGVADGALGNGSLGITNFASLTPVFWIVLGLVIIIGMLLGVFMVYGRND